MSTFEKIFFAGSLFAIAMLLQAGCATSQQAAEQTPAGQTVAQPAKSANQTPPQPKEQILAGKVIETMSSGRYTYVNLEKNGQSNWIAIPQANLTVGQEIKVKPGDEMGVFPSRTLNRTFDSIIFSPGLESETTSAGAANAQTAIENQMPVGHPAIGKQQEMPPGHPAADVTMSAPSAEQQARIDERAKHMTATISGKVVETMSSAGYTYLNVEQDGNKIWVAVPNMVVSVGQTVELKGGGEFTNFTSRSLNRTFDKIIFSAGPITK